jgi:hypothetical protein
MKSTNANGHVTKAEFRQFETRMDERDKHMAERFDTLCTKIDDLKKEDKEFTVQCGTIREKCVSKIDKKFNNQGQKIKWLIYGLVVLGLTLVLSHPQSIEIIGGLVKAPISVEQVMK